MLAGVLWGTSGTAQALSPYPGSPSGLGAARIAVAGLVLGGVALVRTSRDGLRGLARRGVRGYAVAGMLALAAYQGSFFYATRTNGVVVGTLTAIGSAPVLAGLLGLVTGDRPSRRWLVSTALVLAGLVLLVAPSGGGIEATPLGIAAGIGAGASYAGYTWTSRRMLDAGVPPDAALGAMFVGGALVLVPLAPVATAGWFAHAPGVVAYLGLVATALPYLVWIRGVARTAPALTTTLSVTEPLTATLLGAALLHEPMTAARLAGAGLICAGLVSAVVRGRGSRAGPGTRPDGRPPG